MNKNKKKTKVNEVTTYLFSARCRKGKNAVHKPKKNKVMRNVCK